LETLLARASAHPCAMPDHATAGRAPDDPHVATRRGLTSNTLWRFAFAACVAFWAAAGYVWL